VSDDLEFEFEFERVVKFKVKLKFKLEFELEFECSSLGTDGTVRGWALARTADGAKKFKNKRRKQKYIQYNNVSVLVRVCH
jgi:hypothetical protein